MNELTCPKCGSTSTYKSKKFNYGYEKIVAKSLQKQLARTKNGMTVWRELIIGTMSLHRLPLCPGLFHIRN